MVKPRIDSASRLISAQPRAASHAVAEHGRLGSWLAICHRAHCSRVTMAATAKLQVVVRSHFGIELPWGIRVSIPAAGIYAFP